MCSLAAGVKTSGHALCRWDGADETERPELQPLAAKLIDVDCVTRQPEIVIELVPEFQDAIAKAKERLNQAQAAQ